MRYAEQRTLFHEDRPAECMRGPLNTCLAPCAGRCTQQQYAQQIEAAQALLDGSDTSIIDSLQTLMQEAASQHQYERAATLRDAWTELTFLNEHFQLMRDVRRDYWFVYTVPCSGGFTLWMFVAGGNVVKVVRQPDSEESVYRCLQLLEAIYDGGDRESWDEDLDQMQLVASWFRQYPDEMKSALQPEQAMAHCRSGLQL